MDKYQTFYIYIAKFDQTYELLKSSQIYNSQIGIFIPFITHGVEIRMLINE